MIETAPISVAAFDADQVAFVRDGFGPVRLWNSITGSNRRTALTPDGEVMELAIGGARLALLEFVSSSHSETFAVSTCLIRGLCSSFESYNGDLGRPFFVGNVRADDGLVVYNSFDGTTRALWRVRRGRTLVTSGRNAGAVLDVDEGRIVVRRADGDVLVLRSDGSVVHRLAFLPRVVRGARLSRAQLVVCRRARLELYDLRTRRRVRIVRLRPETDGVPSLEDVRRGFAVYVAGIAIHLVRLSDGRDRVLHFEGQSGRAHVGLERRGLFYAYNEAGAARPGRIGLVPYARLRAALDAG